jgi:hypothetical protein
MPVMTPTIGAIMIIIWIRIPPIIWIVIVISISIIWWNYRKIPNATTN